MQKLTRSLLAVGAVIGLAACGDDVTVTPPPAPPAPTVTAVTVSPGAATIKVGESVVFSAALTTTGTVTNTAVTWTSAQPSIASVSATGTVTGVAIGTTTIRAASAANPSATGAGSVTVTAPGASSVSVTPSVATLAVGQTLTAVANVTRDPGVSGAVTWASSAPAIATVGANDGLITAIAAGTAVITATSVADPTKSASLSVTVNQQANALQSLTVTPGNVSIGPGNTIVLTTLFQAANGATVTFANSTSNAAAATVTPTGANPTITGVSNGSAVITITATGSGPGLVTNSISQTVTVNINAASVSISSLTTCVGGTVGPPPTACTVQPVNLAGVFGQIEATLNLTSGSQTIDSVTVEIGGVQVASQVFGVNGAPVAPVTLSINTAFFDPITYAARTFNGPNTLVAKIYPHGASNPTASNTVQFTLANNDVVYFNPSVDPPTGVAGIDHQGNSATGSDANTWWKGGFEYTAHVVNYSQAIVSITYTSESPDDDLTTASKKAAWKASAARLGGSRGATVLQASQFSDNPDCGSATGIAPTFTATFVCDGFEGPQNIANTIIIEYQPGYLLTPKPTGFVTATTPGFVPGNPVWSVVNTWEDNVGPRTETPEFHNVNVAGWHGNGSAGAVVWGMVFPGVTYTVAAQDGGVGILQTNPGIIEVTTGLAVTAANQLPPTPTPAPYTLMGIAVNDILGNVGFPSGAVCTGCFPNSPVFGVDLEVTDAQYANRPTSALASIFPLLPVGIGGNATIFAEVTPTATNPSWAATHDGTSESVAVDAIDNNGSGLDNLNALTQRIVKSTPLTGLNGGVACLGSTPPSPLTTYAMSTVLSDQYVQSAPQQLDCGTVGGSRTGRYSWSSFVTDRAGNVLVPFMGAVSSTTPLDSVYVIIDEGSPNITGVGFQTALYTGGAPAAFSFSANDDYEIKDGTITLRYGNTPGVGFIPWTTAPPLLTYNFGAALFSPATFSVSPWDNVFVSVLNGQTLTLNNLIGNFETVNGAPGSGQVSGFKSSGIINNVVANVRDWAGQIGAGITANILPTQVGPTPAVSWSTITSTGAAGPIDNMTSWRIFAKSATSVTVQQQGVTQFSLAACSRVDIYEAAAGAVAGPLDGGTTSLIWRAQGNFTQATTPFQDNGLQRIYSYVVTIPGSVTGSAVYTAVCVAGGRGLATELFF